jgi:hypothetical protein
MLTAFRLILVDTVHGWDHPEGGFTMWLARLGGCFIFLGARSELAGLL